MQIRLLRAHKIGGGRHSTAQVYQNNDDLIRHDKNKSKNEKTKKRTAKTRRCLAGEVNTRSGRPSKRAENGSTAGKTNDEKKNVFKNKRKQIVLTNGGCGENTLLWSCTTRTQHEPRVFYKYLIFSASPQSFNNTPSRDDNNYSASDDVCGYYPPLGKTASWTGVYSPAIRSSPMQTGSHRERARRGGRRRCILVWTIRWNVIYGVLFLSESAFFFLHFFSRSDAGRREC